jgi:hypothetical protein
MQVLRRRVRQAAEVGRAPDALHRPHPETGGSAAKPLARGELPAETVPCDGGRYLGLSLGVTGTVATYRSGWKWWCCCG